MQLTHIANPVRVTAVRILEVTDITDRRDGMGQTSPDLTLRLEDGHSLTAGSDMTARYVPVAGDYVVIQEDGYIYLNPKDVFERKYSAIGSGGHSVSAMDQMVTRFLGWKLPADFAPDAGLAFDSRNRDPRGHQWPTGTNLLHAGQARDMFEYVLGSPVATFGDALVALKDGKKVARSGWNGKGMWLSLSGPLEGRSISHDKFWSPHNAQYALDQPDSEARVLPCITMKTATGEILMGWLASQSDMLAEDWVVVL